MPRSPHHREEALASAALKDDERDLAAGLRLIRVVIGPNLGHTGPECGMFLRCRVLEKMATPVQHQQILQFFHDGFLDRIDQERGFVYAGSDTPAYGWIRRFNSMGIVTPIIPKVWDSWWSIVTPGQAVCVLMYVSGLLYLKGENPIFDVWATFTGGDGPYLWTNDSYINDQGWHPDNVAFLERTLSVEYLAGKVDRAVQVLLGEPEETIARQIQHDLTKQSWVIEIRPEDIVGRLADPRYFVSDW